MTCIRVIHHRLKTERSEVVVRALMSAYSNTNGVVLPVRYFALEDRHTRARKETESEFLIPKDRVDDFQEATLGLIRKRADDETLLSLRKCAAVLFHWRDWADEHEVKNWTSKIIDYPEKAIKLLEHLLSTTYSSAGGKKYWLSGKGIESIVDLDRLLSSVKSCDLSDLDDLGRLSVELLQRAIQRRDSGQP